MELISICLSDIPKSRIKKSETNGKFYVNLVVSERKERDQFDNDLAISMSKTKEEREEKADTIWVGSGKSYKKPEKVEEMATASESDLDDLSY